MKKNKPLRAAGILLIATMLTTSMVSGTFAKYTAGDHAEDSARVAKFGVTVTADGSLFGEEYNPVGSGNGIITYSSAANTGTVQVSAQGENVVAPGTKNDTGLGFSVKGKPEVDVTLDGSAITTKNVYLKEGTYGVMVPVTGITDANFAAAGDLYTKAGETYTKAAAYNPSVTNYYKLQDKAVLGADYYPIVFELTGDTAYNSGTTASDSLAEIKTALETKLAVTGGVHQANTDLAGAALNLDNEVITWEWAFDNNDAADTILGDLAAKAKGDTTFVGTVVKLDTTDNNYKAPVADPNDNPDYNLNVEFNLTLKVTQVD